jgi:hypothetical protein
MGVFERGVKNFRTQWVIMLEFYSYAEMLDFLVVEVKSKSSGTLFIRSHCNHAISFGLENGRINSVFFGPRRGNKAIAKIREITGGSYRFDPNNVGTIPQTLPSTEEILAHLTLSREPPEQSPRTTDSSSISEADRTLICHQLKEILVKYLGPIAEIVLNDAMYETEHFCSTMEEAQLFIDQLAQDIEDPAERVQFRSQANNVIEKVFKT